MWEGIHLVLATLAPRYPHARHRSTRAGATLLSLLLAVAAMVAGSLSPASAAAAQPTSTRLGPSTTSTTYGATVGLHVQLLSDTGVPLAGRTVAYDVHRGGTTWGYLGSARTDSRGRAVLARRMTVTQSFRARHVGDSRWAGSTSTHVTVRVAGLGARVLTEAARHYGKAYQWGAVGPHRFDCSGFTRYVFARFGKSLPHNSGQQAGVTRRIDPAAKQPGDLIFTWTSGRITHVGIYAGNNEMWAATKSGDIVRKQTLYSRSITVGRVA